MARFATEEWDIDTCTNYDNLYMQWTNYAINKENGMVISDNPHDDFGHKRLLTTIYEVRKIFIMRHVICLNRSRG